MRVPDASPSRKRAQNPTTFSQATSADVKLSRKPAHVHASEGVFVESECRDAIRSLCSTDLNSSPVMLFYQLRLRRWRACASLRAASGGEELRAEIFLVMVRCLQFIVRAVERMDARLISEQVSEESLSCSDLVMSGFLRTDRVSELYKLCAFFQ